MGGNLRSVATDIARDCRLIDRSVEFDSWNSFLYLYPRVISGTVAVHFGGSGRGFIRGVPFRDELDPGFRSKVEVGLGFVGEVVVFANRRLLVDVCTEFG